MLRAFFRVLAIAFGFMGKVIVIKLACFRYAWLSTARHKQRLAFVCLFKVFPFLRIKLKRMDFFTVK